MKKLFILLFLFPLILEAQNTNVRSVVSGNNVLYYRGVTPLYVGSGEITDGKYYVSVDGNDSNTGSIGSPWKTVAKVNATVFNPGDIIHFRAGDTWDETLEVGQSGTSDSYITYTSYDSGANPIFDGEDTRTYGIKIDGKSYIKILDIDVTGATEDGIVIFDWYQVGSTNVYIDGCTSSDNGQTGINANIPYVTVRNCTANDNGTTNNHHGVYMGKTSLDDIIYADNFLVENCHASGNSGAGFHLNECGGGTIRYCIGHDNGIEDAGGWGLVIYSTEANKTINAYYNIFYNDIYYGINVGYLAAGDIVNIYNNVMYYCGQDDYGAGLYVENNDAVEDGAIRIKNNLIFSNVYLDFIQTGTVGEYDVANNLYWRSTGNMITWGGSTYTQAQFATYQGASGDANSVSSDPLVTSAGTYDFTLQALSPCVNAGVNVTSIPQVDYVGGTRDGTVDIGAYER